MNQQTSTPMQNPCNSNDLDAARDACTRRRPSDRGCPNSLLVLVSTVSMLACGATPADLSSTSVDPDAGECLVRPTGPATAQPRLAGTLSDPDLVEASGMAFSQRRDGVIWMINDSGNGSNLFAVGTDGASLGTWALDAANYDWEDMASVRHNGDAYLLVADVGDNRRARSQYRVDVFREPESIDGGAAEALRPAASIRFRFEGVSRNMEAVATDGEYIYLLGKPRYAVSQTERSPIFRIPFSVVPSDEVHVAERLGDLPLRAPALPPGETDLFTNVMINVPTAFDISADGRYAHLLTYRNVIRFEREPEQSWVEALETGGRWIHTHELPQAEAMATATDGTVWFTSELPDAELWVLPSPP